MKMLSMIIKNVRKSGTQQFRFSANKIILSGIAMMMVISGLSIKAQDAGYSQFSVRPLITTLVMLALHWA